MEKLIEKLVISNAYVKKLFSKDTSWLLFGNQVSKNMRCLNSASAES